MREIDTIILHCSDSSWGNIEEIDHWHENRSFYVEFYDSWNGFHHKTQSGKKYIHCGYHYVILNGWIQTNVHSPQLDGLVELGRPLHIMGAHARGYNKTSIGICLVGKDSFTSKQFSVLDNLIDELLEKYPSITKIIGHCEVDSGKTCPNFDISRFKGKIT